MEKANSIVSSKWSETFHLNLEFQYINVLNVTLMLRFSDTGFTFALLNTISLTHTEIQKYILSEISKFLRTLTHLNAYKYKISIKRFRYRLTERNSQNKLRVWHPKSSYFTSISPRLCT